MTYTPTPPGARRHISPEWILAVGQATGGVAHDLNNALTAIITRATVLKVTAENAEVAEHSQAILDAAAAAADVIGRIRSIFNPAATSEYVQVEPAAVLRQAAELTQPRATLKDVTLAVEAADCPSVAGMPGELMQVITNLATNAVDAAPPGSQVVLRCRGEGEHVLFEVQDSGAGIPAALQDKVFEPFVSTKGAAGTGLGLVLCRRILETHEGSLTLKPRPEGGTMALVRLPPAGREIAVPRRSTSLDLGAVSTAASVLLTDDDVATLDALTILLEAAGFVVHSARTIAGALETFDRVQPTLVVTDLGLGDEDGWTLVRRLRARDALVPIVVVSGDATVTTSADEARRGVEAVIRKPINPGSLVNLLRELAEAQRNLRERLDATND